MLRATTDDDSAETACAVDSRQNVPPSARIRQATNDFDAAVELLWPWTNARRRDSQNYPGRLVLMQAVFGERARPNTIKSWRCGYRPPPQWATELLASLMRQRAGELLSAAEALEKKKGAD